MAEVSRRFSPYNYAENDPIRMTDPDGMDAIDDQLHNADDDWNKNADLRNELEVEARQPQTNATPSATGNGSGDGGCCKTGPNDKTKVAVWNNMPYIALHTVTISSTPIYDLNSKGWRKAMDDNPYMATYKEDQDAALSLLWLATAEIGGEFVGPAMRGVRSLFKVAEIGSDALDGSFSISNWEGYPDIEGGAKPSGPFRLIEGEEYQEAFNSKKAINQALHNANPEWDGLHIHEIQPIKFGGSPTDIANNYY